MKRYFGLLILVLLIVSMACQFIPASKETPIPTKEPEKVKATEIMPEPEPAQAEQASPSEPEPQDEAQNEPTPQEEEQESSKDYHEEFDTNAQDYDEFIQNYPNWRDQSDELFPFILTGNTQKNAQFYTDESQLVVKLGGYEETHLKIYEKDHLFKNVVVSTEFENFGANRNKVGLLCKVNKNGWYEFQINNEGYYWIYRYDTGLKQEGKVPYVMILDERATNLIHTGEKKNTISMACTDEKFTFKINDKELTYDKMNIPQTKVKEFNKFANVEGGTGLAVYSWHETPGNIEVHFDYFDAKVPEE